MAKNQRKIKKAFFISLIILAIIILIVLMQKFDKPSFREDSLDNPQNKNENGDTKPLLLQGSSDIGVLLIHGLGATTFETKKLAEYLNARNITTYQVLLAGHGEDIYDLEQTSSEEWYESVENAYYVIEKPKKFVIGSSVGGLLAIELCEKKQINGVILISTPITFNDKRIRYAPLLRFFKRYSHREIEEENEEFYHENFPLKTVAEMVKYINNVKTIIPDVASSALIIQSRNDPRVEYKSAQYIYDNIGAEKKEIIWSNSSKHTIIIEYSDDEQEDRDERDAIFDRIYEFIIENSK